MGLAACASTPSARFASSVKDAQATNRPLVIYQFDTAANYMRFEHYPSNYVYGVYAGLSFINTAQVPIQKVVFDITTVSLDGKPITGDVTAVGDFLPGNSYSVVSKSPLWTVTHGYACPSLTGIKVLYQDGSTATVTVPEAAPYLTPQINTDCAPSTRAFSYYPLNSMPPNNRVVGPGPGSNTSPGHGP